MVVWVVVRVAVSKGVGAVGGEERRVIGMTGGCGDGAVGVG